MSRSFVIKSQITVFLGKQAMNSLLHKLLASREIP